MRFRRSQKCLEDFQEYFRAVSECLKRFQGRHMNVSGLTGEDKDGLPLDILSAF